MACSCKALDKPNSTPGSDDRSMFLRAELSSNGRTYTISYSASDASGNAATVAAVVQVAYEGRP